MSQASCPASQIMAHISRLSQCTLLELFQLHPDFNSTGTRFTSHLGCLIQICTYVSNFYLFQAYLCGSIPGPHAVQSYLTLTSLIPLHGFNAAEVSAEPPEMVPQDPPCSWGLLGCRLKAFWEQEQQSTASHSRKEQDLFTQVGCVGNALHYWKKNQPLAKHIPSSDARNVILPKWHHIP